MTPSYIGADPISETTGLVIIGRSYLFIVEPIKGFPQIHDLFLRRPVGDHGARDSLELVCASVSEDVLGNSVQTLMHHLAFSIWVLFQLQPRVLDSNLRCWPLLGVADEQTRDELYRLFRDMLPPRRVEVVVSLSNRLYLFTSTTGLKGLLVA